MNFPTVWLQVLIHALNFFYHKTSTISVEIWNNNKRQQGGRREEAGRAEETTGQGKAGHRIQYFKHYCPCYVNTVNMYVWTCVESALDPWLLNTKQIYKVGWIHF